MAHFSISTSLADRSESGDIKLCCRCGTKLDEPEDSRLVEIARSRPVELHQNSKVWIDVVGDISPHSTEATKGTEFSLSSESKVMKNKFM